MPLQATSGAASYDAFGGGAAVVPNYIEECFSCFLYTGNGSTQTINNGIDLAGKGGLVWIKSRSNALQHTLIDTVRGQNRILRSNNADAQSTSDPGTGLTSFNSTGFTLGPSWSEGTNSNGVTNASWTFREQPKFFDVVTYSGSNSLQTINHNLGSAPGCIIIKKLDSTNGDRGWQVYHRSLTNPNTYYLELDTTAAEATVGASYIHNVTSTSFSLGGGYTAINRDNSTYVACLFAHNAGGFGLTGTDNVISCGSYTGNGSATGPVVTLGYEPQWLMIKNATTAGDGWVMFDNMRGMPVGSADALLLANTSGAETSGERLSPTATGFQITSTVSSMNDSGNTYIYIAIRRGPMKVPTTGTSVFQPLTRNGTGGATTVTSTVRPDTVLQNWRDGGLGSASHFMYDRLRGVAQALFTDTTGAESTQTATGINAFNNLSYGIAGAGSMNNGSALYADYVFTRAPGFFDEVCYTGTGSARTVAHNLAAVPQLMLVKQRTASPVGTPFAVYSATMGNTGIMFLNSDGGNQGPDTQWNSTTPTASVFSVGSSLEVNQSGSTYVAYLFASCPGVSRVGSYTGTGTTQVIDCGFTAGSRFVMIKRVGTGDWYVWDSARGIVAGNDPYLLLNSTAAEVTNTDFIDTASTGFEISSTAPAAINASGGTFIFFAVA